jgi:hypothetical protein
LEVGMCLAHSLGGSYAKGGEKSTIIFGRKYAKFFVTDVCSL